MLCASFVVFGITEIEGGFPHSEIRGSKVVRTSPRLIAAYHVLHRLSAPRHPPDTLKALDRSHYRCPPLGSGSSTCVLMASIERPVCFKRTRERRGQAAPTVTGARSWSGRTDKPRRTVRYARATNVDRIRFLFTMSDNPRTLARSRNFSLDAAWAGWAFAGIRRLVEPDGIEPTTSCLQSTRSPN